MLFPIFFQFWCNFSLHSWGTFEGRNTHSRKAENVFAWKMSHYLPQHTPKVYSSNVRAINCWFVIVVASHPDNFVGESISKVETAWARWWGVGSNLARCWFVKCRKRVSHSLGSRCIKSLSLWEWQCSDTRILAPEVKDIKNLVLHLIVRGKRHHHFCCTQKWTTGFF